MSTARRTATMRAPAPVSASNSVPAPGWERWTVPISRLLLGLVFLWFGFHELTQPRLWTGYVPVISATSQLAVVAVLAHGWLLFVLGVALAVGIAPRLAGVVAAVLMLQIVLSLAVHGLNDIVLRDVGILGLAIAVAGQRAVRRT